MRSEPTEAEGLLWHAVRDRKLDSIKICRQHVFSSYIVDFYCAKAELVFEVDGLIHESQKEFDRNREEDLRTMGYRLIRFSNNEVLKNIDEVLVRIRKTIRVENLRPSQLPG